MSSATSNVLMLAAQTGARDPQRPALVFEDGLSVSHGELRDAVERFAGYLRPRLAPGERVAIMLENRAEFIVAWLGAVASNAILVPINPTAGAYDAGHVLRDSAAAIAIVGEAQERLVAGLAGELQELRETIVVRGESPGGLSAYRGEREPLATLVERVDPEAVTNIYYTSGTTGAPKGCMLGHDFWLRFAELYCELYGMSREDRLLCCVPFFYVDPLLLFVTSLYADTTVVAMRGFSVSRFWSVVRAFGVTRFYTVASIPSLLLKAPADERDRDHKVNLAVHAGIPPALHRQFVDRWGFPWVELYGLTESGIVTAMPVERAAEMTGSGSIGVPAPGVDVRICAPDGGDCAAGEPGEIAMRAPGMMRGYWNRPDATAETLRDGWLYTGDLGYRDERGFLYLAGRIKDIIRRAGENVAAGEVEALLRAHPLISDAAVVPVPDELRGEEVKAYLELESDATPADLPPGEVVAYCAERLARHKVPRYLTYQAEPFPRTPSMRIKKADLLAAASDLTAGAWDRCAE